MGNIQRLNFRMRKRAKYVFSCVETWLNGENILMVHLDASAVTDVAYTLSCITDPRK